MVASKAIHQTKANPQVSKSMVSKLVSTESRYFSHTQLSNYSAICGFR